jgi:hypothetical protein
MSNWQNQYYSDEEYDNRADIYIDDFNCLITYDIKFVYEDNEYHCVVDSVGINDALGKFFRLHNDIRYKDIVEIKPWE